MAFCCSIKKDILPHVQSLCQDCQFEVRANMCAQLPIIAKGLSGESVVTSALLPNLVELCNDENMMVRIAGIDAISSFLTYIQDCKCFILPNNLFNILGNTPFYFILCV